MSMMPDFGVADPSPYLVTSPREIASLLRKLSARGQLVRLAIQGGSDTALTVLLEIDEDSGSLVFDRTRSALQNQLIADGAALWFDTALDRIRIVFEADGAALHDYLGQPAFRCALPAGLYRLQRRESYRVPLRCPIQIPFRTAQGIHLVEAELRNISAGGIAIVVDEILDAAIGRLYQDCRIVLPDGEAIITSLRIANTQQVMLPGGGTSRHLGCQFLGMTSLTLNRLQRHLLWQEREQIARGGG